MRILMITTEFPTPEHPGGGAFIFRQAAALRDAGVKVDMLAFRSKGNPVNHYNAWCKLRQMMQENRYDLIHGQFAHSLIPAQFQFRLPMVVTFRGSDALGIVGPQGKYTLKGWVFQAVGQLVSLRASAVIAVSEAIGKKLWRKDYTVIPSGLDLEQFAPIPRDDARHQLGWPVDRPIVLFAALQIHDPRKRYTLAQASVEQAAKQLGREVELRVVSGVAPEQMPLYLNAGDVLLLTSKHEGSPNVVKEALACNVPVVSVDVGDVRERLEGVHSCHLCEDDSAAAIAEALVPLLREPQRSDGREKVSVLAEPLLAQQVITVYKKVLGRHDAGI